MNFFFFLKARSGTTAALFACLCLILAVVSVQATPRRHLSEAPSWCESTFPGLIDSITLFRPYCRAPVPPPSDPTRGIDPPSIRVHQSSRVRRHPRSASPKDRTPSESPTEELVPSDPEIQEDAQSSGTAAPSEPDPEDGGDGEDADPSLDKPDAFLLGPDMKREKLDAEQQRQSDRARDCDIIFASFFATKPGGFDRKKGERCNGCHEAPMFITFESARLTNPGACTAVITDTETVVDMSKPGMDQVMVHRFKGMDRSKIGTGGLMVERMKIYNAFIKRARNQEWKAKLIMVDTDIVIVGSVEELFDKDPDFDYGLTIRESNPYPVQGGVQYVNSGRYEGAARFSDYVLRKWLQGLNGKEGGFTGDQRAYQEGTGYSAKAIIALAAKGKTAMVKKTPEGPGSDGEECKIKLFPGSKYNFVPSGTGLAMKKADIRIMHYKGGRKEGMFIPYNALKKGGIKAVHSLKKLT